MPLFSYKAIDVNGVTTTGTNDAPDRFVVSRNLKDRGLMLVSAEETLEKHSVIDEKVRQLFGRISMREKIMFARNMGSMLEAGLTLSRILSVIDRQSRNDKFKKTVSTINNEIRAGKTLNEAMAAFPKAFSPLFIAMVRSGEESGNLAGSLKTLSGQMEKSYLLQKRLRGALIYPAIVICLIAVIGVLMFIYVVPTLTNTFKELNVELPWSTQLIVSTSDFLRYHTFAFVAAIVAVVSGLILFKRSVVGKKMIERTMLKLPIIGVLVKEANSARTARTLSSLLSAGVSFLAAMEITRDVVQNGFYKEVLEKARLNVQKGDPISSVFIENEHLYPAFVGEMTSVGEETGQLAEMMLGIATFYEGEVEQKTKDMSTIIEPLLMVMIGCAVGFFAVSMISPTYSLLDNI
ncbi:MAG: type II secretion system F family protein [Patescibacteria group bacterium]